MENNYENLKQKAYKLALKFKKTHLKEEIIYAKLEKQGFPEDIIKEVAMNLVIEINKQNKKDIFDYKKWTLIVTSIWVLLSIITFFFTGNISNTLGVFFYGIGATFLIHAMTTNR